MHKFYSLLGKGTLTIAMAASLQTAYAQAGCTDPEATNYNPNAKTNDGSCVYKETSVDLTEIDKLDSKIDQSSGLAIIGGEVWTHNDLADGKIYKINPSTAATTQVVTLDVKVEDAEDIGADGTYIYLGDFGNNKSERKNLKIWRIEKSKIGSGATANVAADSIPFEYADQTTFSGSAYDCNSMAVIGNDIYVFTKGTSKANVYKVSKTPGAKQKVAIHESFDVQGSPYGASYDAVKKEVALISWGSDNQLWLFNDFTGDKIFSGNKRMITLDQSNLQGVCYPSTGKFYLSNEGSSLYSLAKTDWSGGTSVEELIKQQIATIYPNPANDVLHIEGGNDPENVVVLNMTGQVVKEFGKTRTVNISDLAAGTYFLRLYNKTGIKQEDKFIKL